MTKSTGRRIERGYPGMCVVPLCGKAAVTMRHCNAHYIRLRKGMDMAKPVRRQEAGRLCTVSGCARQHYGHGVCNKHYDRQVRKQRWQRLVDLHGGECRHCHGVFPIEVYDFHHVDPKQKSFSIGSAMGNVSWEKMLYETTKCDLLCANCHRILHFRSDDLPEAPIPFR